MSINELVKQAEENWQLEKLCQDLSEAKKIYTRRARKQTLSPKETDCLCGLLCSRQPKEIAQLLNVKPDGLNVDLTQYLYRYIELLIQTKTDELVQIQWSNIPIKLEQLGYKKNPSLPTPSTEVRRLWRLTIDLPLLDSKKIEQIIDIIKRITGNSSVRLERIDTGSVVLIFDGTQVGFEQIQELFRTNQLTEILGVPILDVRLEPAPSATNWRQLLQNFVEQLYWQTAELVLASTHRSTDYPSETIANLIELIQTSQNQTVVRQALQKLGKTGTSDPAAINAITQLLQNSQDQDTLWEAAISLGKLDPHHPLAGVERAKVIDIGTETNSQLVALIAAFRPKIDGEISILLRVEPVSEDEIYLPPNLTLSGLDESQQAFITRQSGNSDNFLVARFSAPSGNRFSVKISLGDASITEEFLT